MAQRDPSTQERWMAQVQAWRSSGKSLSAWAREHGVSHYALRYWKRRAEGKARSVGKPKASQSQAPKFIAVRADSPAPGAPIELLVGALRVVVPAGFEAQTLAAVLAVLQQGCRSERMSRCTSPRSLRTCAITRSLPLRGAARWRTCW